MLQRTNVALSAHGGTASASGYLGAPYNYYPSYVNDGSRAATNGNIWLDNTFQSFPDWVQIDFNGNKSIDEIDVITQQDNNENPSEPTLTQTFNNWGITAFNVQYWDGASWVTVPNGSVTSNNHVWRQFTFSPLTTSKIRVIVNAGVDNVYSRVVEVEAWGTPAVALNYALPINGGAASASGYLGAPYNYYPSYVNDGSRAATNGNIWLDNTFQSFPDWVQIDFNGNKSIDEIDVITQQDNNQNPSEPTLTQTFNNWGITAFNVQYWDGASWVTVPNGSVTSNNHVWRQFTFSPLTTSKIRVIVNAGVDNVYSRVVEVEAWGAHSFDPSAASGFAMARIDPHNRTGAGGVDLLSNNFNWSLPLVGLPGRGLDLGLTLSYNSLVWTKNGNDIDFDLDDGSIAPGFRLGFPTIEGPYFNNQANANFYLLVTPTGGRVELRQTSTGSTVYESKDSSYLQFTDNVDGTATLRSTDGSQMSYTPVNGSWRCNKITDRNGNYITATYKSWGEIDAVTDTLGRVLTFNYDGNYNLQSITQQWAGQQQPHQWATFGWGTASIGNNFAGLNNLGPNNTTIPVLTLVGLPDGSKYTFGYNGFGQVNSISRAPSDNLNHSYTVYEYGASNGDCPRVTQTRTWATNWSDQQGVPHEVATSFAHDTDGGCRMTMPDGTVYKEYYAGSAGVPPAPPWQNGLLLETRNYASAADANSNLWQKRTTTAWTQDNLSASYLTNPRAIQTDIDDRDGNHRRTTIDCGDTSLGYVRWGLPYIVKEYGVVGTTATELRRTQTDYNLTQPYLNQRIIGLISSMKLYDPIAAQWQAKTTYSYDGTTANTQATTATQHDQGYNSSFTVRGNVTSVSRWDVTDIDNSNKALTSSVTYNAAGSAVSSTDPANHTSSISYADSFSDNQNHNTFAYPTTATDAGGFSSTVQYRYEHGAKVRVQTPLPNVITNQPGPVTTFEYDDALRIKRVTSLTNNAYTRYEYGADYVQTLSSVNTVNDEAFTFQLLNGLGQVFIAGGNHPGSTGGYRAAKTYYDQMGRVMKQSNPTEIDGSWTPAGDDIYNAQTDTGGWRFTQQSYDWKGRTTQTTHPDGAFTTASYSGCGCAGGEVVTLTDEMSRRQKVYSDVLGRQWKSEVLNWNGTVYQTTTNSFNALDQVTLARQTDNATGIFQDTSMSFDGYGRLQTKHVPEQDTGTNTTWEYNNDDTIHTVTDARGSVQNFAYNNRHLPTEISYAVPSGSGIPVTPTVTFGYDSSGNRTSMTDGVGSVSYAYDQLSRLTSETRSISQLNQSYEMDYAYNLSGQLTSVSMPAWSRQFGYTYDSSGRVNSITGSGYVTGYYSGTSPNLSWNSQSVTTFASNITYRASGAIKQMTYGNGIQQSLSYNSRMQSTQNQLTNFNQSVTAATTYQYYADGKIQHAYRTDNSNFDRSFSYDQAGRVANALTGNEAHGGNTPNGPYRESFLYDVWGNTTSFSKRLWEGNTNTDNASFSNNRHENWGYDANGFITWSFDGQIFYGHEYDAAGKRTHLIPQVGDVYGQPAVEMTDTFEGNGTPIKRVDTRRYVDENLQSHSIATTTYYLHSTAVGGQVIAELDSQGNKTSSHVYAQGMEIAKEQMGGWPSGAIVLWQYSDPITGSNGTSGIQRDYSGTTELDPLGADVTNPPPPVDESNYQSPVYSEPFKQTYFQIEGGPTADHVVDKWYTNMVNKEFDKHMAELYWAHGFRDWAMEIVANNPNVGIVWRQLDKKGNIKNSGTKWGANAAAFLFGVSKQIESGQLIEAGGYAEVEGYEIGEPQNPKKQGPHILNNPDTLSANGKNCNLTVTFTSGTSYSGHPELKNGVSSIPYNGISSFGLGFTVSGLTKGGVGKVGAASNPKNPGGTWTMDQSTSRYVELNGQVISDDHEKSRRDISTGINYSTSGDSFSWYDHPGGPPNEGLLRMQNFTVSVSNGTESCAVSFHFLQQGNTIRWGNGSFP